MPIKGFVRGMVAVAVAGLAIWFSGPTVPAMQSTTSALTGSVTSPQGRLEGVLVSAKRTGSNVTITVVTDASGAYSFPRTRLEPGEYTLQVRAADYILRPVTKVTVTAAAPAVKDLQLAAVTDFEKALQLSSAEWLMSYPLAGSEIYDTLRDCTRCHDQQRVAMSRFNEKQLQHVMQRMTAYWLGSTPVTYQLHQDTVAHWGRRGGVQARPSSRLESRQAAAVAAINLSNGPWQYPLKRYPRPKGENTNVIYTTYDLPRVAAKPHDVQMGPDGWIYYDDFNDTFLGKLNPKTGEVVEWDLQDKLPALRAESTDSMMVTGHRVLMSDQSGKMYLTPPSFRGGEGYVIVYDPKTEKFEFYPGLGHFVQPKGSHVDGYVWVDREGGHASRVKLLGDGKMAKEFVGDGLGFYDAYVDSKNNFYGGRRESKQFWRVDAKTLKVTHYPIPTQRGETAFHGEGGPRRGLFDKQDRLWFGSFDGEVIGKFDPSKPADKAVELIPVPMPWFQPYMAQSDDKGYVWTGSTSADHVARMDEKTGKWNFYLLPGETNVRHLLVQPSDSGPSSLWIGMNHQAKIVHIEPR